MTAPVARGPGLRPGQLVAEWLHGIAGVTVVEASEPRFCVVCHHERRTFARWPCGRGVTGCPHCSPPRHGGYHPIPIVFMPMRDDKPRRAA